MTKGGRGSSLGRGSLGFGAAAERLHRARGVRARHGAVLVEPEVAWDLRGSAELAQQERQIAGGLLYGCTWTDDEGPYLVVEGSLS